MGRPKASTNKKSAATAAPSPATEDADEIGEGGGRKVTDGRFVAPLDVTIGPFATETSTLSGHKRRSSTGAADSGGITRKRARRSVEVEAAADVTERSAAVEGQTLPNNLHAALSTAMPSTLFGDMTVGVEAGAGASNRTPSSAPNVKRPPFSDFKAFSGVSNSTYNPSPSSSDHGTSDAPMKRFTDFIACPHIQSIQPEIVAKKALWKPVKWSCEVCETREDAWLCTGCGHIGCGRDVKGHARMHFDEIRAKSSKKGGDKKASAAKEATSTRDGKKGSPNDPNSHAIAVRMRDGSAHCYACDEWVLPGNDGGGVEQVQLRLQLAMYGIHPSEDVVKHVLSEIESKHADPALMSTRHQAKKNEVALNVIQDLARQRAAQPNPEDIPGFSKTDEKEQLEKDREETAKSFYIKRLLHRVFLAWLSANDAPASPAAVTAPPSPDKSAEMSALSTSPFDASAPSPAAFGQSGRAGSSMLSSAARRLGLIPGRTGLRNMGNSCYVSATIQALAHVSRLKEYFRSFMFFDYPTNLTLTPLPPKKGSTGKEAFATNLSAAMGRAKLIPLFTPHLGSTPSGANQFFPPGVPRSGPGVGPSTPLVSSGPSKVPSDFSLDSNGLDDSVSYALPAPVRLVRQSTYSVYDDMTNARKDGRLPPSKTKDSPPSHPPLSSTPVNTTPEAAPKSATSSVKKATPEADTEPGPTPTKPSAVRAIVGGIVGGKSGKQKPAARKVTVKRPPSSTKSTKLVKKTEGDPWADSLVMQTFRTIRLLWSGRWAVFTPAGLIFAIWRTLPQFQTFAQQDAQEFFNAFVDALHEELKRGGVPKGLPTASALMMPAPSPAEPVKSLALGSSVSTGSVGSRAASLSKPFLDTPVRPSILSTISASRSIGPSATASTAMEEDGVHAISLPASVSVHPPSQSAMALVDYRPSETPTKTLGYPALDSELLSPSEESLETVHAPTIHSLPRFPQSTFLEDLFGGSTISNVTCSVCSSVSSRVETFNCMSLEICGVKPHLFDCLKAWSTPEVLTGDTAYFCDHCAAKTTAHKRTMLHKLPEAFAIHLNRAQWTARGSGRKEKLHTFVEFPLFFQTGIIADYLSSDAKEVYCSESFTHAWYRLQAVVVHQGRGIDTGHYTAFCFDVEHNTWVLYDDHKVNVALWGEVQKAQAYLLVYERVTAAEISSEAKMHQQ